MTPEAAAAQYLGRTSAGTRATARASAIAGVPARRPPADAPARPDLRVVPRTRQHGRRRPVALLACGALLLATLLAVVVGHAILAQGQARLTSVQNAVTTAQARERSEELSVARLETPARIVHQAEQQDHMVSPAQVGQVPSVPLSTPLPAPSVIGGTGTTGGGSTAATGG